MPEANDLQAQIRGLLKRINKDPDKLHSDYTQAVNDLIKIGAPALKHGVLELLVSDDINTRMRAQRVLEGITMAEMGFVAGHGWQGGNREGEWSRLWEANGSYDWHFAKQLRHASYQKWVQWVQQSKKGEEAKSP